MTNRPDDKYFGIVGPPNSALPNTFKPLLRNITKKQMKLQTVYTATENVKDPALTVNGKPFF